MSDNNQLIQLLNDPEKLALIAQDREKLIQVVNDTLKMLTSGVPIVQQISNGAMYLAEAIRNGLHVIEVGVKNVYSFECFDPFGNLKWVDDIGNLVVNTGLNDILDKYWKGSAYTAAHYIGLTDGTPTVAAGDTMASHAGWVEVTAYSQATRPVLTMGTVSSQSVDNSASKGVYTINANNTTIGGAFVGSDNTKGGTAGTLVGAGAFSAGDKTIDNGDTLNVTVTSTASSS